MRNSPSHILSKSISTLFAFAVIAGGAHAQTTRTWDGGGTGGTNMDTAVNWSGDTVPSGTPGDTAQWDGTVAGDLSLTYTAAGGGANLAAGGGVFLNILGTQTGSLTINEASGTAGLRIRDLTVASGAGALTFGGTAGTDFLTLGSGAVLNHAWTNNSSNAVTFNSDVAFGAGGGATHVLTLTGTGNWNVNTSLIRSGTGTINLVKSGTGTLNLNNVNAAGNSLFTINSGTLDNTSGAALTLTNTTQTWNGDFAFSTAGSTAANDLSLGAGTVSLGTAAGTSRTITTNGLALLTAAGVISNGTTANSLIKAGTGGLRLDGNNTYTGGTTLLDGQLHIGNNAALGTGTLTINGGVLVPRLAARTLANAVVVGGDFGLGLVPFNNQINLSGNIDLGGATRTITVADISLTPDSTISGVMSNGGFTKAGAGTMVLTGNNTYTGTTTVSEGTLLLSGSGAINSSSGITIDGSGARFLQTSSVASTPAITLTSGTLDGVGTVGAVAVGASGSGILANGNGTTGTLTTGNLNFGGVATVNIASIAGSVGIAAGTLSTSGTDGDVVIGINRTGAWANGANNLISYTSIVSPDINDFTLGSVIGPALGARQSIAGLVFNGNNIALQVDGTSIYWTGLTSNQWTTAPVGGLQNWKQTSNNAATDFIDADDVVFNDTPGTSQTIQINDADVFTTTTTFNNSAAVDYTINGVFGISGGSLTKSGTGSLTINTTNFYNGGTTLTSGTLNLGNASALGSGPITINGGTVDNTSGAPLTFTFNNTQDWNGDFTFTGSNDLDMGTGTVTLGGTGDRTVTVAAGTLTVGEMKTAGTRGFTKQGVGTLVVTSDGSNPAASVVTGVLNVAAGTLQINRASGVTGDFAAAGIIGGGEITNGAASERWLFSNAATGTFDFTGTLSNGAGGGALGFNKSGASTQILSGNNNYSGVTTVAGGTLTITGTNSAGGAVSVTGSVATPAILNLQNSNALGTSVVTATSRNGGIQLQGGITLPSTVTFITSNDGMLGAAVPYAFNNVSGNNTVNGTITLTSGGGGSVIQSDSGALTIAGNITIAAGQTSRGIILQGASTDANTVSGVLSDLSGSSTSLASITKNGTGTWTVSGANTYSGGTIVNGGTLNATNDTALGSGALSLTPAEGTATVNFTSATPAIASLASSGAGTSAVVLGNTTTPAATTLTVGGTASTNFAGVISDLSGTIAAAIGSLTKTGTGMLTLSGTTANTYTGLTTVDNGLLALNKTAGINGVGGNITISGTGQLSLLAGEQVPNTATITLLGSSIDSVLTSAAVETVANVVVNSSTPGAGGGQVIMRNGFTVTGTGTVSSGIFGVGSGNTATVNAINITSAPGADGILRVAGNTAASTLNVGPGGITASGGEIQVKFSLTDFDAVLNLGGDFTATDSVLISDAGYNGPSQHIINLVNGPRTFNITAGTTTVAPDIGDGTLNKAGDGSLVLNGKLGTTGAFTLNANDGLTTINESQTISSLVIGDGATVVLGEDLTPALAPGDAALAFGAEPSGFDGAASSFGDGAQMAAVPEPGSVGLLLAGALGLLARRRRGSSFHHQKL